MDAVIAWVDGDDPELKQKRLNALSGQSDRKAKGSNAIAETRFADTGEIYFCIASILKYAPFIDQIFVVTDNQKPSQLDSFAKEGICLSGKIKIIDHKEIFDGYQEYLPTFNSITIATMLWRIRGLKQQFVYFNDDVFLNGPVGQDTFFNANDQMLVCGNRRSVFPLNVKLKLRRLRYKLMRKGALPAHFKTTQSLSAQLAGLNSYVQIGHHPHAMRKSTLADYFTAHDEVLREQISHQFRAATQFSAIGLCNHLELAQGTGINCPPRECVYLKPGRLSPAQLAAFETVEPAFACVQSLDLCTPSEIADIHDRLATKFQGSVPRAVLNHLGIEGA